MKMRIGRAGLALIGGLALFAAACAPATQEKAPAPPAEKPAAEKPAAAQPAAEKPAAEKPAAEKPAAPKPAAEKATTSVSGIPLDSNAKRGGVLRVALTLQGPSFNMWEETQSQVEQFNQPVTNMIVRARTWGTVEDYRNKAYFEIHPDLAKSWEASSDGLRWTFRLRDGVAFEDGVLFTCEDTKWSLDTIRTGQGLKRSPRATWFTPVKSIECVDRLTMVVNLKWPQSGLPEKLISYNVVYPKHKYANNLDDLRNTPNMGSGPFRVTQFIPGEKSTLTRKDNYWNSPFPYLNGIELISVSTSAVPTALRAGRLDIGSDLGYQAGPAQTLVKECTKCQVWDTVHGAALLPLYVNHQRPPWNDSLIKESLHYAIDKQKLLDLPYGGQWGSLPVGGGYLPDSYWAMPQERVARLPGGDFKNVEANKKKARDLLTQAGYRPGELKMKLLVWSVIQNNIPPIVEDLESVGFKVEATPMESAAFFSVMTAGDFEVGLHSFFLGGIDPDLLLYEHFYTGSDRNYGRYSNPAMDRLIDLQSATLDRAERRRVAWDAMELAWRESAKHILLNQAGYTPIVGERVRGYMPGPNYLSAHGPILRYEHVWLAE